MSRGETSIGLRIVAYITIAVSTWLLFLTLFASIRYSREILIGAVIIAIATILTLLMAGIVVCNYETRQLRREESTEETT
jgi:hypothetical protein